MTEYTIVRYVYERTSRSLGSPRYSVYECIHEELTGPPVKKTLKESGLTLAQAKRRVKNLRGE